MAKKTVTAMNSETRLSAFEKMVDMFEANGYEIYQTDASSFDFAVTREDDKELMVTVKMTLHKEDYDLNEKVTEWEMKKEEQRKKAEEKERKAAENMKKKAEREAKKKKKDDVEE